MKTCTGVCNNPNFSQYQCKGTVKEVRIQGYADTFWYCDTAIGLCRKLYEVTIIDSCSNDCKTSNACTCDMNILMLRGCQCGGN